MEFVHNGPVMVWEEDLGQYVSPDTGGVLPPRTAAAYFRGILDGLVRGLALGRGAFRRRGQRPPVRVGAEVGTKEIGSSSVGQGREGCPAVAL